MLKSISTCHPDFFLRQTGGTSGAVDCVLQPAKNDDIIRAVENARARIMKYQRLDNIKINKFSSAAQNTAIRSFLRAGRRWRLDSQDAF